MKLVNCHCGGRKMCVSCYLRSNKWIMAHLQQHAAQWYDITCNIWQKFQILKCFRSHRRNSANYRVCQMLSRCTNTNSRIIYDYFVAQDIVWFDTECPHIWLIQFLCATVIISGRINNILKGVKSNVQQFYLRYFSPVGKNVYVFPLWLYWMNL